MYAKIKHPERPFVLHIFVGVKPEDISKKLNRQKGRTMYFPSDYFDQENNNDEALTHDLEDVLSGHFCIQFNSFPDIGTIAHEVFHVVAKHMRYVSLPLTESSEESYAYMFSWLVNEINNKIQKDVRKNKAQSS